MKRDRRSRIQKHILGMAYILGILFGIMVIRYAWLQLVQGDNLAERMREQVGLDFAIQSPRGTILDRNGREMAVSVMTKSLYVDPNHVKDPDELAANLAPLIDMPEQEILDDIQVGGGFVWIKRRMEHDEYEKVRAMIREHEYTDCLGFRDEAKRYYPNDMLAANVVGFVGTDDKGLDGIEQGLDSLLKGEVKEKFLTTDRQNRPILDSIFSNQRSYQGEYCKSVQLTLDSSIQFIVEQELDRAMAENNPKGITCVVMDPKTGEILAMASRPSYNPIASGIISRKSGRIKPYPLSMSRARRSNRLSLRQPCRKKSYRPIRCSWIRDTSWSRGAASRTGAGQALAQSHLRMSSSSR